MSGHMDYKGEAARRNHARHAEPSLPAHGIAKQGARCATCNHLAVMHENRAGGCWQALGPNRLCLCKAYAARTGGGPARPPTQAKLTR